jgi:hypothetical protein
MNVAQRNWLAASFIVVGLALSGSAFGLDRRSFDQPIVSFRTHYNVHENRFEEEGIFVRWRWAVNSDSILGQSVFIWGGVLPLCLVAASGFVLLGNRK